jgi:hypothetical protein
MQIDDILKKSADEITLEEFLLLCNTLRQNDALVAELKKLAPSKINGKPYFDVDDMDLSVNLGEPFEQHVVIAEALMSTLLHETPFVYGSVVSNNVEVLAQHGISILTASGWSDVRLDLGPFVIGE